MGSYLHGFVEYRISYEVDWRFVLKTATIAGSQGNFRDVFANRGDYFPEIPHTEGFPEDLSRETKAVNAADLLNGHIDNMDNYQVSEDDFKDEKDGIPYRFIDDLEDPHILELGRHKLYIEGNRAYAQYMTYEDLEGIWKDQVRDSTIEGIKENTRSRDGRPRNSKTVEECFNLIQKSGDEEKKFTDRWLKETNLTREELGKLVLEDKIQKKNKEYRLEKKQRKDAINDEWWPIWDIMKNLSESVGKENVRMVVFRT